MKKSDSSKAVFYSIIGLIIVLFLALSQRCEGQIQQDKQLHFGAGLVIAPWGMATVPYKSDFKQSMTGMVWATGAGVLKETLDLAGFGTPEIKDLGYTVAGAITGVLIVNGVKVVIREVRKNKKYKKPKRR